MSSNIKLEISEPNKKQWEFLNESEHKYVGYGGARGGGKSWAVRVKAVLLCLKYPKIKVMIIRKTYPELQENHIIPLCEMLNTEGDKKHRKATYNDSKKHIKFKNGSRILFRYCENDKDALRFQGTEVDVLFVDEATHQTEERMEKLKACVRGVNNFPKRIYYTCNPGGEGHSWVKRLFIDKNYKEGEYPEEYTFIQALPQDNLALMESDPDYIKQLEALPPKLRAAWLYGDWDIFEGQFFEDFRVQPDLKAAREAGCELDIEELRRQRRWTHVIEPFDINSGVCRTWNIYASYDFGYGKPFSYTWWAMDTQGILYRVLELYGCTGTPNEGVKWTPDQQFKEIARIENEHPWLKGRKIVDRIADPAIFDASRGESIADTAMKYGIHFSPGDNQRIPGWMQCHYRLQFDENGYPRMYVFNTCKAFLRTVPLMMYSTTKPEDLDTTLEDHACDEWRYLCMSRPIKALIKAETPAILSDPLNQLAGGITKYRRY